MVGTTRLPISWAADEETSPLAKLVAPPLVVVPLAVLPPLVLTPPPLVLTPPPLVDTPAVSFPSVRSICIGALLPLPQIPLTLSDCLVRDAGPPVTRVDFAVVALGTLPHARGGRLIGRNPGGDVNTLSAAGKGVARPAVTFGASFVVVLSYGVLLKKKKKK
jgi:hypothetical protein